MNKVNEAKIDNTNEGGQKPEYVREMKFLNKQLAQFQKDREYNLKLRKQLKKRIKEAFF